MYKRLMLLLICLWPVMGHALKYYTYDLDLNDKRAFDQSVLKKNRLIASIEYIGQESELEYKVYKVKLKPQPNDDSIDLGREYSRLMQSTFDSHYLLVTPVKGLAVRFHAFKAMPTRVACLKELYSTADALKEIYVNSYKYGDKAGVYEYDAVWKRYRYSAWHVKHPGPRMFRNEGGYSFEHQKDDYELNEIRKKDHVTPFSHGGPFYMYMLPLQKEKYEADLAAENFYWRLQDTESDLIMGMKCTTRNGKGLFLQHSIISYRGVYQLREEQEGARSNRNIQNYKKQKQKDLESEYEL